jgi:hypothetical protein
MKHEAMEAVAAAGSKMTFGGAGTAVFFGITAEFWGVICGLIVGLAGLGINWYYKAKAHRLLEKEYAKKGIVEDDE